MANDEDITTFVDIAACLDSPLAEVQIFLGFSTTRFSEEVEDGLTIA